MANTYFGFNPPFWDGGSRVLPTQIDERLIKNDILQALLTLPGERVYNPNFGSPLRGLVFENLVDTDMDELAATIANSITDQRVLVTRSTATLEDAALMIRIEFVLTHQPLTTYVFSVALNQSGTISTS